MFRDRCLRSRSRRSRCLRSRCLRSGSSIGSVGDRGGRSGGSGYRSCRSRRRLGFGSGCRFVLRLRRPCNLRIADGGGQFHESHFDEEAFVAGIAVTVFVIGRDVEPAKQEWKATGGRLLGETVAEGFAYLHEFMGGRVERDHQVAEMLAETGDEMLTFETFFDNLLIKEECVGKVAGTEIVDEAEIVVSIEHVEILVAELTGEVALGEADELVESGEGIAQTAFGLAGYDVECFFVVIDMLFLGDGFEV